MIWSGLSECLKKVEPSWCSKDIWYWSCICVWFHNLCCRNFWRLPDFEEIDLAFDGPNPAALITETQRSCKPKLPLSGRLFPKLMMLVILYNKIIVLMNDWIFKSDYIIVFLQWWWIWSSKIVFCTRYSLENDLKINAAWWNGFSIFVCRFPLLPSISLPDLTLHFLTSFKNFKF